MNHITKRQHIAVILMLLFAGGIVAAQAWREPGAQPPGGNIHISEGGVLHAGLERQWKHPGTRVGWPEYEGGCPSAPNLYVNGFYLGNSSSRCLDADRLDGSLEVEDVNLRDSLGLDTWASALYRSAPTFRVNSFFSVRTIAPDSNRRSAVAICPTPYAPPSGGGTYYRVVGCSGSVYDSLDPTASRCLNYGDCGLIGAEFVRSAGNNRWTLAENAASAEGCMIRSDDDNRSRAVAIAHCVELQAP